MRLALLQLDIAWEQVAENHRRAGALLERAREGGAGLAILPEMFNTGFSMNPERVAEPPGAATERFVQERARTLGLWIAGSIPMEIEGKYYNTALVVSPDGSIARYRKIHPFSYGEEHRHYAGGDRVVTVPALDGIGVTPFVCYDLRFPEAFRAAAEKTGLYVVVANWPDTRREHWRLLLRARAIENQCFVAGVNRIGEGGRLVYAGDSAVIDPMGETLVEAGARDEVVFADIDPKRVSDIRERFPFLRDRRPDSFYASSKGNRDL